MEYTSNLNLGKPSGDDLVDISVLNDNMDKLDTQVNQNKTAIDSIRQDVDSKVTGKADKTYVDEKLAEKADATALETKADQSDLLNKADKSYVTNQITTLSNEVDAKLQNYATNTIVQQVSNAAGNRIDGLAGLVIMYKDGMPTTDPEDTTVTETTSDSE